MVETIEALEKSHPGRFCTFANVNFDNVDDPVWSNREAKRLEAGFKAGARGLKFYKNFGLGVRYKDGRFMAVDDAKLNAIWDLCAKYDRPVLIHTADPAAFWAPLDEMPKGLHRAVIELPGGDLEVPAFLVGGMPLWGFSFRVLCDLFDLVGWPGERVRVPPKTSPGGPKPARR